jgi:hypothetical protein
MAACEYGSIAVVKVLLSAQGIDVDVKNSEVSLRGMEFLFCL